MKPKKDQTGSVYQKIYAAVRMIPEGRVSTYGWIARLAGSGSARLVGYAMAGLRYGTDVPWHRVINHKGRISPRSGGDGDAIQRALLENEGVAFDKQSRVDLKRYGWPGNDGADHFKKERSSMFQKQNNDGYKTMMDGIEMKTLISGEKTLMTEFRLRKGACLPDHAHPHEQTGYMISGRMRLRIGAETFMAEPGDSWCIPGDMQHGADILEDTVAVEVFSPVREEYLS